MTKNGWVQVLTAKIQYKIEYNEMKDMCYVCFLQEDHGKGFKALVVALCFMTNVTHPLCYDILGRMSLSVHSHLIRVEYPWATPIEKNHVKKQIELLDSFLAGKFDDLTESTVDLMKLIYIDEWSFIQSGGILAMVGDPDEARRTGIRVYPIVKRKPVPVNRFMMYTFIVNAHKDNLFDMALLKRFYVRFRHDRIDFLPMDCDTLNEEQTLIIQKFMVKNYAFRNNLSKFGLIA